MIHQQWYAFLKFSVLNVNTNFKPKPDAQPPQNADNNNNNKEETKVEEKAETAKVETKQVVKTAEEREKEENERRENVEFLYEPPEWSSPSKHKFHLDVLKNGSIVETIDLSKKDHLLIGIFIFSFFITVSFFVLEIAFHSFTFSFLILTSFPFFSHLLFSFSSFRTIASVRHHF